jgi:ubiquinone/menaquinone biosynthesis C-methylase UbiE
MISERLLSVVRCPDCRGRPVRDGQILVCPACGRSLGTPTGEYLDLRPARAFTETTKYTDEALHADARHEHVSPPLLGAAIRNDMLRRLLRPGPVDRVLDLGCGSGRMALWNRDLGAWTIGVDVSPFFAQESRSTIDLVLGDLRRLPFGDASFDKAYALDVLEHLSHDAAREMLAEAARVLVPGGQLFLYSHVRKNSRLALGLRAINRLAGRLERMGLIDTRQERLRKSDHVNPLADLPDLHETVGAAGFRIAEIRYYTPLVGAFIENILMRTVERALARRAARRLRANRGAAAGPETDLAAVREARTMTKARLARGGPLLAVMRSLSWLMKIDLALFGSVESGPFFALLVKR